MNPITTSTFQYFNISIFQQPKRRRPKVTCQPLPHVTHRKQLPRTTASTSLHAAFAGLRRARRLRSFLCCCIRSLSLLRPRPRLHCCRSASGCAAAPPSRGGGLVPFGSRRCRHRSLCVAVVAGRLGLPLSVGCYLAFVSSQSRSPPRRYGERGYISRAALR